MTAHRLLALWAMSLSAVFALAQPRPAHTSDPLTTLPFLQTLADRLLQGRQGSIVALRPSTGEVLCMASHSTSASHINRAITGIYAPGSTFKTAQALVLRSEGVIDAQAEFLCRDGFTVGPTHVGCHAHAPSLNMTQALAQSCNTWFCQSQLAMIGDTDRYESHWRAMNRWAEYMRSMGFGHTLGIDMNNEAAGLIPDGQWFSRRYGDTWDERRTMFLGMGQGPITVTPLQLCNLCATIANRGFYYTPYIHRSSASKNPSRYRTRHFTLANREAYDEVVRGMRQAVTSGTCKAVNTSRYTLCGKTGTVENGGKDHAAFIGFAPMDRPQIAVAVYIEHAGFGADTAAPIAAAIIKAYMTHRP